MTYKEWLYKSILGVLIILWVLTFVGIVLAAEQKFTDTPWLVIAMEEYNRGVKEINGASHNKRIVMYHQTTSLKATDDETPWCSSFISWIMVQAGIESTNSAWARSWLSWGTVQDKPIVGSIVIFSRKGSTKYGHVGIYLGEVGGRIKVLGGNQDDSVSIKLYNKSRLLGTRWPNGDKND